MICVNKNQGVAHLQVRALLVRVYRYGTTMYNVLYSTYVAYESIHVLCGYFYNITDSTLYMDYA